MPVRQVGTQATWKTKRDPVTLPPMGPIGGGGILSTKPENCNIVHAGPFSIFFSVFQPLNSLKCLCLLDS